MASPSTDMHLEARCFHAYFAVIKKIRIFIIIFWILALCVGVYFGPKFLDNTKTTFDAPPGTPSHDAEQVFQREFSGKPLTAILLIESTRKQSVLGPFVEELTGKLKDAMQSWGAAGQFVGLAG